MILVDANLLIYAHHQASEFHPRARAWFEAALQGSDDVGIAWMTILAFLRITTNRHIFARGFAMAEAEKIVAEWMGHPAVRIVPAGDRHWEILSRMLLAGQAGSELVSDAHLAALAIEHGAVVCTTDRDFARFPGLRWQNPLQS
ncbi:MAG: type II toxin-antitoxin system VapC family toxin [Terriglobales bacterium]